MGKKFILNIKNKQIAEAVHQEEVKESPAAKNKPSEEHSESHGERSHGEKNKAASTPPIESPPLESVKASPEAVKASRTQETSLQDQEIGEVESKVDVHIEKQVHSRDPSPTELESNEPTAIETEHEENLTSQEEAQKAHVKARSTSAFTEGTKQELKFKPNKSHSTFNARPQRDSYEPRPQRAAYEQKSEIKPAFSSLKPPASAPKTEDFTSPHAKSLKEENLHKPPQLPPISGSKFVKLGPTGRHVKDLVPQRPVRPKFNPTERTGPTRTPFNPAYKPAAPAAPSLPAVEGKGIQKKGKKSTFKEYEDVKTSRFKTGGPTKAPSNLLNTTDEEGFHHRKRRHAKIQKREEIVTIRPDKLKIRTPISVKDLAVEMKLKASQLIGKLFLEGVIVTINDYLEDTTTIELLGHEFGCTISIDKSEQERIRITSETIQEEIQSSDPSQLTTRAPVVAFMGHVDHGKTSLIDRIRSSNRTAHEAGAITQHIGAFLYETAVGPIAILDTPGHEAFSAMRARGADVTDIVVLVIAGDEGIRQQTDEAIQHAKAAKVSIVVALNKCDKPNFNAETIYRQLSERDLLPEAWGGEIITVNCSATTGEGINQLLEMLALQAEVLELKANPKGRARGTVLESEMHKGMGAVATIIVQNGTLKRGDSIVFEEFWGRIKTMRDEYGNELIEAGPSHPVEITGLSGLPEAGQEFIVVSSEKEAKEIAQARSTDVKEKSLTRTRKRSLDSFLQDDKMEEGKKVLNLILRADMQGSLEALKTAIEKIPSDKVRIEVVLSGVGEVSESDVQLAAASNATIIGFHTQVESHAESLMKEYQVTARIHDIIYHALDDVKALMKGTLDKLAQEVEKGKAEVLAMFKSSQVGTIAGCKVTEGTILRNYRVRIRRKNEVVWTGGIASIKRHQDDVREVQKGFECGIVLQGTPILQEGDILEAFEIIYISQEI